MMSPTPMISLFSAFQLNHEEEDPDEEEMGVAETYAEYWPAKRE